MKKMMKMKASILLLLLSLLCITGTQAGDPPTPPTPLSPGVPVQGTVASDSYAYFSLEITEADSEKEVVFSVTPIGSGDPDLYCSKETEYPDADNHEKRAIDWGADSITYPPADLPKDLPAKLYCGVRGWISTEFTIVAFFGDSVLELQDGTPQSGTLDSGSKHFFSFQLTDPAPEDNGDIIFSATAFAGELKIFVSNSETLPDPDDPETFQWQSQPKHTGEVLLVFPTDPQWPEDGRFSLTLVGYEDATSYSLVASRNETNILLRDGLPQQGWVGGDGLGYYKAVVTEEGCDLRVTVTPTSGDPDLYMSTTNTHPNPQDYERRSWGLGGDSITYSPAPAGPYYIGVHAFSTESSYVITATTSGCGQNEDTQWLLPGIPQHGRLEALATAFYRLGVRGDDVDVRLSVTRDFGDPDLYVTTDGSKPSLTNYQFRAVSWGEDLLEIRPSDPGYCGDCEYWIMVWAASNTSYTLTGSTSEGTTVLREGIPLRAAVNTDEYTYFRFSHDNWGKTITFSVTDLNRGDPDLFISTKNPNPTWEDHTWSSQGVSGDSVTIPTNDPNYCNLCSFYIGVYGYEASDFTILVTYEEIIHLSDGVPQVASVTQGGMKYFLLQMNEVETPVMFTVTNHVGITNMYIGTCENANPGGENCALPIPEDDSTYTWVVYGITGDRSHRIDPSASEEACRNPGCMYVVGVEGWTDSDFTLLGRTENATIPLRNAVPQEGFNTAETWQYFSYEVDTPDRNLAFIVTPLSGDPDIYVSLSNPRPNRTDHDKSGVRWGEDIVDFIPANISQYWVGVVAYTDTAYTITALETDASGEDEKNVIQLQDGIPQTGLVYTGFYQYFSFQSPEDAADITFTLTRRFGDPDLYIQNDGTFPNRTNYRWSSSSASDDIVRIPTPEPGRYLAAVYGYHTSSFTITATTGITNLQDSIPVRGQLETGEYRYYRVILSDPGKDLVITVTPFTGDPDLYMSRESSLGPGELPNMTNWEWASQSYLGDSITVPHTDPNYEQGAYIVGVYSYIASSYSIMFSVSGNVTLQDGVPQSGTVARKAFKYYRLQVSEHKTLTLSVTPMSGNPNLYVTSGPIESVRQPTLEHWDRKADGWYTGNEIIYNTQDPDFCAGEDCMYWIGVYGEEASNFSIIATTDRKSVALRDGVPIQAHAGTGEFSYFRFHMTDPGNSLIITVTPLTGDPDIYADDENVYPNQTDYKWVARGSGADALSIPDTKVGFYYIGIFGYSNTTFTVTALVWDPEQSNKTIHLVDGVPQNGAIPEKGWMFYRLNLWSEIGIPDGGDTGFEDLTFSLSKTVGDPDMYITDDSSLPSQDNWKWKSSDWGADSVRIIKPEDGVYTVGVYGFTASSFTVLGASTKSSRTLLHGIPFTENLDTGKYHYFKFWVDNTESDLTVTVTAFHGDPDLFMSTIHERPNSTHSEWKGQGYLEDSITVPSDQLTIGHYYISVYAYQNTTYTIVANLNSTVTLQNGVPQNGYLPARDSAAYYQITVPENYPDLSVYLAPVTGNFYLYLSHTQKPIHNDPSTYQWSSFDSTGQQQILLKRGEEGFCDDCTRFWVMVYSVSRGPASFNIVGSTSVNGLITLIDGMPQRRSLAQDGWEYFRFNLQNPKAALILSVTPISGDPDMYVSTSTHRPSPENSTWSSTGWGEDIINIDYTDPNYETGDFYIGIHAFEQTSYTISAQVIDLSDADDTRDVHLFNGQPQIGFLPASNQERYFLFAVERDTSSARSGEEEEEEDSLTIVVVPRYGDPDLLVYTGPDPRATPDNAQWKSQDWGRDAVTIPPSDPEYCRDSVCVYKITVKAFTPSLFTVTASAGASIRMLEMSVPFRDEVNQEEYRYFQLAVHRFNYPLVIAATVLSSEHELGDPDMYISHESSGIHYPNQTHHDWAENHFGSDIFSLAQPKLGFYYVSIRGYRPTSFSLTAWNGPITLLQGEPQKGVVTSDAPALFILIVNEDEDEDGDDLEFTLLLDNIGGMEVDMWICTDHSGCSDPGPDNFQWTNRNASESGIPNLVTISRKDPNFCHQCLYYLRVISRTRSAFTLSAGFNSDLQTIVSGKPITAHANSESYRFYRAAVDSSEQRRQDIFISATLFTGEIVVIGSFDVMRPTLDSDPDLIWKSDRITTGAAHLTLSHEDPRFKTDRPLFLSVYSYEESRFSLSLTTGHLQLLDGQPLLGVVPKRPEDEETPYFGAQFFFQNHVPAGRRPSDIAITLNRRTPGPLDVVESSRDSRMLQEFTTAATTTTTARSVLWKPDLPTVEFTDDALKSTLLSSSPAAAMDSPFTVYVTTSDSNITNPGPDNYQWQSRFMDYGTLLLPSENDPKFCTECTYFVAVYGDSGAEFSIKIATAESYVMLLEGEVDHSSVRPNRYRYFGMFVENAENFTAIVEPCVGSVAVYASQSNYRPTKERHTWKSDTPGAIQEISNAEGDIRDRTFYLAVLGRQEQNSEFLIHAHTQVRPKIHPRPGDVGAISTVTKEVGAIQLSFTSATPSQDDGSGDEKELRYTVYSRKLEGKSPEQEGAVMFTMCGLQRGSSVAGKFNAKPSTQPELLTYTVKNLEPGKYYSFNIVVQDPVTGGLALYTGTPGIQILGEDEIGGKDGVEVGLIFAIGLPLLLLGTICVGILWYRNRKLTRAARAIQMQDVPEQAVRKAVRDPSDPSSGTGAGAKKYHQLLADEDSFVTEDLGYNPPDIGASGSLNNSQLDV